MNNLRFFNHNSISNDPNTAYAAAFSLIGGHTPGQNSDVYWVNEHVDPTSSEAQLLVLMGDGMTGSSKTLPLVKELLTGYWAAEKVVKGFPFAFRQQYHHLSMESRIRAAISQITDRMKNQYNAFLLQQLQSLKGISTIPDHYLPSATTFSGIIRDPLQTTFFAIGNSPAFAKGPMGVKSQALIGHPDGWVWPCGVYAEKGQVETLDGWFVNPNYLNIFSVENHLLQGHYGVICGDGFIKNAWHLSSGEEIVDPSYETELIRCFDLSSLTITMQNLEKHALLGHMTPDWDDDKTIVVVKF